MIYVPLSNRQSAQLNVFIRPLEDCDLADLRKDPLSARQTCAPGLLHRMTAHVHCSEFRSGRYDMTTSLPLSPIPDTDWPTEIANMLEGFAGQLNVYRLMAHHPSLLRAWADLRDHVVNGTALGAERSEIVILRTGHLLGSTYEWAHHVVRGRKAGLSDARIAKLAGSVGDMQPEDALLAQAVDQLFEQKALTPRVQQDLTALVGNAGMLDLIATVGFYSTLAYMLNSFDPPLDEAVAQALAKAPLFER